MPPNHLSYILCCYCLTSYFWRQHICRAATSSRWFESWRQFGLRYFAMSAQCSNESKVLRLGAVAGSSDKHVDVLFSGEPCSEYKGEVVFFGGDVQDYPEAMMSHRDNKRHVDWNLEKTALLLSHRFPRYKVWVIRPYKMQLKTFSVYSNFVESNDIGCPTHYPGQNSWKELQMLLKHAEKRRTEMEGGEPKAIEDLPLVLVAFSKGCVVLNQLVYDLKLAREDAELAPFVKRVKAMYWLDGGHNGGSNTWITSDDVLQNLAGMDLEVFAHVTPYQIKDPMRKWIGREQKRFVQKLEKLGIKVTNKVHFGEEERCIDLHFAVLKAF